MVEADPYGGDLAIRCRVDDRPLPATPTVLGMTAGRPQRVSSGSDGPADPGGWPGWGRPRALDLWSEGSHRLNRLVRVVPGFMNAEQGEGLGWPAAAATMCAQTVPVFADLGRIHTGSPSLPIAAAADAVITLCRAERGSVQHLLTRLEQLVPALAERVGRPPVVVPVVVSPRRTGARHAAQVAELVADTAAGPAVRGVGWLAWDPRGLSFLEAGSEPWGWPLDRSPLMRSAREAIGVLGAATGLDHAAHGRARRGSPEGLDGLRARRPRSRVALGRRGHPRGPSASSTGQPDGGQDQVARAPVSGVRRLDPVATAVAQRRPLSGPFETSRIWSATREAGPAVSQPELNGNAVNGSPVGDDAVGEGG